MSCSAGQVERSRTGQAASVVDRIGLKDIGVFFCARLEDIFTCRTIKFGEYQEHQRRKEVVQI